MYVQTLKTHLIYYLAHTNLCYVQFTLIGYMHRMNTSIILTYMYYMHRYLQLDAIVLHERSILSNK